MDPLGNETKTEYNDRGFVVKTIAADGAETRFEHDALGRVKRTIDALGNETQNIYDDDGRLVESIDAKGFSTRYVYDSLGRQTKVIDALGNFTESVYDAVGQLVKTIDPEGRETSYEYDQLGRQVRRIGPSGETTITAYNPDGTVASVTNPNGNTTENTYDELNRLVAMADPLGHTVSFEYDAVGNRTKIVDQNGNATTFEYDLLGRLTAVIDAKGQAVRHEYDELGRRIKTTSARGKVTTFSYDAVGRLVRKDACGGAETFAYDPNGRRTLSSSETVTEVFQYDVLGRLVGKHDSNGFSVSHEYDPNGNRVKTMDSRGGTIYREFDALNRLVEIRDQRGRVFEIFYNKAGQETQRVYPNGIVTIKEYGPSGRLVQIRHREQLSGELLAGFEYGYDAGGNRTYDIEHRGYDAWQTVYQHDVRDQLVEATLLSGGRGAKGFRRITYSYDPAGNRTQRDKDGDKDVYTYDELNQILTMDGMTFSFDEDGNMTLEPLDGKNRRHYVYDCESQLVETWVEKLNGNGNQGTQGQGNGNNGKGNGKAKGHEVACEAGKGKKKGLDCDEEPPPDPEPDPESATPKKHHYMTFAYTPDGLKVSVSELHGKTGSEEPKQTELRFWSGGRVLEDVRFDLGNPEAKEHRYYLHQGGQVVSELRGETAGGIYQDLPADDVFYFHDVLGSTVLTMEENLGQTKRFMYLPFGEQVKGDRKTPFTFTGLRREGFNGSGDDLLGAAYRHLRPGLGRWVRRDPAGAVDGPNLYRYVGNDPLNLVDPIGLWARVVVIQHVGNTATVRVTSQAGNYLEFEARDTQEGKVIRDPLTGNVTPLPQSSNDDPAGTNQRIPPGHYKIEPRQSSDSRRGRPTVSSFGQDWNTLITPSGTRRSGIQFHPHGDSLGCIIPEGTRSQRQATYDTFKRILDAEYSRGGVEARVVDGFGLNADHRFAESLSEFLQGP